MKTRVIPVLLLQKQGLYKTVKFKDARYIGDPINSVRIFNEKEVDELAFIDISATPSGRGPDFDLIEEIAGEAFMPMAYGGGVTEFDQVKRIFELGFEKVIFNAAAFDRPALLTETSRIYGAQSVVGCIDVRRGMLGRYETSSHSGARKRSLDPVAHARNLEKLGCGEIVVNSVDRDGTFSGYDLNIIGQVTATCSVPVIALGGAGSLDDMRAAVQDGGASAVAAGSMFVYKGIHRAVLINYPERAELKALLP